ncbi:DUF1015 domain-containing protein [Candidatus Auribacterota bacterium]
MAEIRPFKGILYNKEKIDISKVVTQPYDKIKGSMQDEYYKRDPNNFVRLILDRILPSDNESDNRYIRAANKFGELLKDNILVREDKPLIYVYDQEYTLHDGSRKTRRGLIALMRIEELSKGTVYPHEKTLSKPKTDRFELIKAVRANLEQIFMLYNDSGKVVSGLIEGSKPEKVFEFKDEYGVSHCFSKITDAGLIDKICEAMADKKLFIADGHHRYEVGLNYRDHLRKQENIDNEHGANFRMAMFVDMGSEGLTVFPTHRMLKNIKGFSPEGFIDTAKAFFTVKEMGAGMSGNDALHAMFAEIGDLWSKGGHAFGAYCAGRYYALELKADIDIADAVSKDTPDIAKKLDVSILHNLILEKLLNISSKNVENEDNITYIRDASEGVEGVDNGSYQITFFLNPTKVGEVREVALSGGVMPQKSTDFYPKISSGLVIYKF